MIQPLVARFAVAAMACGLGWAVNGPAGARPKPPFAGPVEAFVVHVLDGDTFVADAQVWPGQTIRVNIRIRGIDAPEMKSRCADERSAALKAREALTTLLGESMVSISNIAGAKYYGRVLADVETAAGLEVAPALLSAALVRPYEGGRRNGWCGGWCG